jgi:hypothetical protein
LGSGNAELGLSPEATQAEQQLAMGHLPAVRAVTARAGADALPRDPEMRQQIDAVQMKFGEAFNRHDVARYGSSIHAGRRSVVAFRFVSSIRQMARNRKELTSSFY